MGLWWYLRYGCWCCWRPDLYSRTNTHLDVFDDEPSLQTVVPTKSSPSVENAPAPSIAKKGSDTTRR